MLGFIAKKSIPRSCVRRKKRAGRSRQPNCMMPITQWLIFESKGIDPGAPEPLSFEQLGDLVTTLAGVFWERNAAALNLGGLRNPSD